MCQHQKVGLTIELNIFQVCIWPQQMQRAKIRDQSEKKGKPPKSFFKEWKNNHVKMAEIPLFFLFAYYSDYVNFLWTDPELFLLCRVDNEYSCLC